MKLCTVLPLLSYHVVFLGQMWYVSQTLSVTNPTQCLYNCIVIYSLELILKNISLQINN